MHYVFISFLNRCEMPIYTPSLKQMQQMLFYAVCFSKQSNTFAYDFEKVDLGQLLGLCSISLLLTAVS